MGRAARGARTNRRITTPIVDRNRGRNTHMSHLEEHGVASNGNAIVHRGPNRNWEGRAARFGVVAICLFLLFVGVAVATVFYGSNILNGHATVTEKLGISGTFPTTYIVGANQVSTITVVSYSNTAMTAYLIVAI